ncbi:unnamed protein product [Paramecium pentaurelia]|uniref:Serine aminopeptidase S33 domain-containing protein n=1 Tax=Paramecium pentaurelia TaxID=43138 RepID=A0A8S1TI94_9CILI|nr:unnamed protein product [Paramecium pentaurelia]
MKKCKLKCCLFLILCNLKNKLLGWFVFKPINLTYQFKEYDLENSNLQEYSIQSEQFSINFVKSPSINLEDKLLSNKQSLIQTQKNKLTFYQIQLLQDLNKEWPNDLEIEGLYLDTKNGKLAIALIQPLNYEIKMVLIHSHSNHPDIGCCMDEYIDFCNKFKIMIIGYDYPGYGLSHGVSSQDSIFNAIECVYHFALSLGFQNSQILLYGQSLGTSPSLYLASQIKIGGIIIKSSFKSILNIISNHEQLHNSDIFRNYEIIEKVTSPILIIHGKLDNLVDIHQIMEMSYKAKNLIEVFIINDGNHNDFGSQSKEFYEKIQNFINILQTL